MTSKLKDFITNLRACKTTEEEKQLILQEKSAIRHQFQLNSHDLKPRNLIKLLFINLQGHDTEFGQIESLNVACRNSFIEKKVGYLTMQIFLHEKSEMLMMATNRISLDLEHPNQYIQGMALSTFCSISDQDMATSIMPKVSKILKDEKSNEYQGFQTNLQDDSFKQQNVKKKALLSAFRVVQKSPSHYDQFIDILKGIFESKNHGLFISALPLYEELIKQTIQKPDQRNKLLPFIMIFVNKVKSLMTHLDPEYTICSINDPFLMITLLRTIFNTLSISKNNGVQFGKGLHDNIQKLLLYSKDLHKPNKKTTNAVLYEVARLALFYKNEEQMLTMGFQILNELLEVGEDSANLQFVALNLLQSLENIREEDLSKLNQHCERVLKILKNQNEDDSLQSLALQVLSKITSSRNVFNIIETFKDLLLNIKNNKYERDDNKKFLKEIVKNIFYMLENKTNQQSEQRITESIKLLLILDNDVPDNNFSSLLNLIGQQEEFQILSLNLVWDHFEGNWGQKNFFQLSVYIFGEYSELICDQKCSFKIDNVLDCLLNIYQQLKDNNSCIYLLNSLSKIIGKNLISNTYQNSCKEIFLFFEKNQYSEIQKRSIEYRTILFDCQLSKEELKEVFQAVPLYVQKEEINVQKIQQQTEVNIFEEIEFQQENSDQKKETIFEDYEMQIELQYSLKNQFSIEGDLLVKNKSLTPIYNITTDLIGINCPSISFKREKVLMISSEQNQKWNFSITINDVDQKNLKLKYIIRFFYDKDMTSDDYRNTKEGFYDLNIESQQQSNQQPQNLLQQEQNIVQDDDPFAIFGNTQKQEEKKVDDNINDYNFI